MNQDQYYIYYDVEEVRHIERHIETYRYNFISIIIFHTYIFSYDILCPHSEQVLDQVSVSGQYISSENTCSCDLDDDRGILERRTAFLRSM